MAEKPVGKEEVIEKDIFVGTIEQGKLLLDTFNQLEKGIKSLAVESSKYFAISIRTLADLEKRKEALDKLVDLEKANTQVLKQKTIVATAIEKLEKDQLKNQQELEKLNQQKLRTAREAEALEKQRIQTDSASLALQKKLETQAKAQAVATANSTAELRKMTRELANLPAGSKEFNELAKRAGILKDKIGDAKDAVKAFASESKLTNAKTLFGQITSDLGNLNFADAADKAKLFSGVIKSMSFSEVIGGIKNFGSTMLELGKSLLANPFTLIVAGLVGIGVALKGLWDDFDRGDIALKDSREAIDKIKDSISGLKKEIIDLSIENERASGKISEAEAKRLKEAEKFKGEFIESRKGLHEEEKKINERFAKETEEISIKHVGTEAKIEAKRQIALKELRDVGALKEKEIIEKYRQRLLLSGSEDNAEFKKQLLEFQKEIHDANVDANEKNIEDAKKAAEKKKKIEEAEGDQRVKDIHQQLEANKEVLDEQIKGIEDKKKAERAEADEIMAMNQANEELTRQVLKEDLEKKNKIREDALKKEAELRKIYSDSIFKGLENQNNREQTLNERKLSELDKQIDFQQQLLVSGQANTYAELQKERAKALDEQARLEKQAAREKEAQALAETFLEFYKLYASEKGGNAFGKALLSTAKGKAGEQIVRAFAGSFKDGVEDLDGAGDGTSDSNVALLSKGESVTTAKGTAETPGLVTAINKKGFEGAQEWAMKNIFPKVNLVSDKSKTEQVNEALMKMLHKDLSDIKKTLASNPDYDFKRNTFGELVGIDKKMGIIEHTTYKKTAPAYSKH